MKRSNRRLLRYLLLVVGGALTIQACVVHRSAIEGHLYDIVTKKPVSAAVVRRTVTYNGTIVPDPGGGTTTVVVHDEHVSTTQEGSYSFSSITRMKQPWGRDVEDQVTIEESARYFVGLYPKELWTESIYLVPRVDDMEACRNNVECLKENESEWRFCCNDSRWSPWCKRFESSGYSRFIDNSKDYVKCNSMQGIDAIKCIKDGYSNRLVPNENSCSHLNDEMTRNFCYLYGAWLDWSAGRPTKGCDRITDKKIPSDYWKEGEGFFIGLKNIEFYGLDDLKAICFKLTPGFRLY